MIKILSKLRKSAPHKDWRFYIYILGWLGASTLIFWFIAIVSNVRDWDNKKTFWGHTRYTAYLFGWFILTFPLWIILIILLPF